MGPPAHSPHVLSQCHWRWSKMTAAAVRPIPLFGAYKQIEKCLEVLLRQSKRGNLCFTFTLEAENYKVNYSQKGMKKSKRPKTIFHCYPDLEVEEHDEHDEHDEENDEKWKKWMKLQEGSPPIDLTPPHPPSYKKFCSGWTTDTKS